MKGGSAMQITARNKGLTKKDRKRIYKSSTAGTEKCETCRATGLEKGVTIYPRAYKTMPILYREVNRNKDKQCKPQRKTLSGGTLIK